MRREPAPTHGASEAELIEDFRVIVADPEREYLPFPGACRNLETLKLAQGLQRAAFIAQLRAGRHVLPEQQPAHERCRGHRLDLLAQRPKRQAVNTRQQSPFAPLQPSKRTTGARWGPRLFAGPQPGCKLSTKDQACRLDAKQSLVNVGGG